MNVCIYVCMHIYIYLYVCVYIHIYIYNICTICMHIVCTYTPMTTFA